MKLLNKEEKKKRDAQHEKPLPKSDGGTKMTMINWGWRGC